MRYLKYILYALLPLVVGGAILFIVYAFKPDDSFALALYLPETTVASLEVPRRQLFGAKHVALTENKSIAPIKRVMERYWFNLERKLSKRIVDMIWFLYDHEGSQEQGVLIQVASKFGSRQLEDITAQSFTEFSWFTPDQELHAHEINPTTVALLPLETSLPSDPVMREQRHKFADRGLVALYISPGSDLLRQQVENTPSQLREYIENNDGIVASADLTDNMLRLFVQESNGTQREDENKVSLYIPDDFLLVIEGDMQEIIQFNESLHPVSRSLNNFVRQLAQENTMLVEDVRSTIAQSEAVLLTGDAWLIAESDDSDELFAFGQELSSWYFPKRVNSVLPDRSEFREFVKNRAEPEIISLGEHDIRMWTQNTATSSDQEFNGHEVYFGTSEATHFITSDRSLAAMQLAHDAKTAFIAQPDVQACLSRYAAGQADAASQIIAGRISDEGIVSDVIDRFVFIQVADSDDTTLLVYCFR